jgi:hypothetical protein
LIVEDAEPSAATLEIALLAIPGVAVEVVPCARQAIEMLENPDASSRDGHRFAHAGDGRL